MYSKYCRIYIEWNTCISWHCSTGHGHTFTILSYIKLTKIWQKVALPRVWTIPRWSKGQCFPRVTQNGAHRRCWWRSPNTWPHFMVCFQPCWVKKNVFNVEEVPGFESFVRWSPIIISWSHDYISMFQYISIPSGYLTVRHGKSPCLVGKPSIIYKWAIYTMAMLNNQRVIYHISWSYPNQLLGCVHESHQQFVPPESPRTTHVYI